MVETRGRDAMDDGINLDSLPKWLRDQIDYNNESAGRSTGRAQRFFSTSDINDPESQKKKEEREFSALLRLLQDPAYARLYTDAVSIVDAGGHATDRALAKLAIEHEFADEHLKALRGGAAALPDGRRVYLGENGKLIAEDGSDVTAKKDEIKGLSETTPTWDEYKEAKKRLEDIERRQKDVEEYRRTTLQPARTRLGDTENPCSPDELKEIIKKTQQAMPEDVKAEYVRPRLASEVSLPKTDSAADEYTKDAALNAPPLLDHFEAVRDGPPTLAAASTPTNAFKNII